MRDDATKISVYLTLLFVRRSRHRPPPPALLAGLLKFIKRYY